MSSEKRTVMIELEAKVYEDMANYCANLDLDIYDFMNELVHYFLRDSLKTLDTMRNGYKEMARINLEICTEFDGCETEVNSHI